MKFYVVRVNSILKYGLLTIIVGALAAFIYFSQDKVVAAFQQKKEIPIYSVDCSEKKVAITFDCAWGSEDIPDILNTLREHDVKSTFFIIGTWAQKYPAAVKTISDEGHDVANHSYSHLKMGSIEKATIRSEIVRCDKILEEITGKKVELFRAPYGEYNNNVVRMGRETNHFTVQWDVDSLDWTPGITRDEILRRINEKVKSGSIILFHNDTPHTAKLLPTIISSLKTRGYQLVPVSELIMKEDYWIDFDGRQKKNN